MDSEKRMELYIHIPFCVRKCAYCDFLSFACKDEVKEEYVGALLQEIDTSFTQYDTRDYTVKSIYFGGGTPSVLYARQIESILCKLRNTFSIESDAEITIEINPGTVDEYKLSEYKKIGINRISIGMQSADNRELRILGRIHTYEDFVKCYELCRKVGFDNVNVDVMTALPNQSVKGLHNTLNKVIELGPEHISAYSLIIEEGTSFYEKYGNIEGPVVGEEKERELYHMTRRVLKQAGYYQYEISNFAKKGRESIHNMGYWTHVPYIGFGLGASSYWNDARYKNVSDFETYMNYPGQKEEMTVLTTQDKMAEFMFLGLRCTKGVFERDFEDVFGVDIRTIYGPVIRKLVSEELLDEEDGRIFLTLTGIDYGNYVFSNFLID